MRYLSVIIALSLVTGCASVTAPAGGQDPVTVWRIGETVEFDCTVSAIAYRIGDVVNGKGRITGVLWHTAQASDGTVVQLMQLPDGPKEGAQLHIVGKVTEKLMVKPSCSCSGSPWCRHEPRHAGWRVSVSQQEKTGPYLLFILLFAGCASSLARDAQSRRGPFQVVFNDSQGPRWSEGHKGYDPKLPGYHFDGAHAWLTFRPLVRNLPQRLVIAVNGHLEAFRIYNDGVRIAITDTAFTQYVSVRKPLRGGRWEETERETLKKTSSCLTSSYLQVKWVKKDDNGYVYYVTLLPKTMVLLRGECRIEWGIIR